MKLFCLAILGMLTFSEVVNAKVHCLDSSYQPKLVVNKSCAQKICMATITCGETKTRTKGGPWTEEDFYPKSITHQSMVCPAVADGSCPVDRFACREAAKKAHFDNLNFKISHSIFHNSKTDDHRTLRYQNLVYVHTRDTGACRDLCIGSVLEYDRENIKKILTQNSKKAVLDYLIENEPAIDTAMIACPGTPHKLFKQAHEHCPNVNDCALDSSMSFEDPAEPGAPQKASTGTPAPGTKAE